jgi:hypothetical protein
VLAAVLSGEGQEGKVVFVDATDSLARQVVAADTASYELAGARTVKTLEQDLQDEKIHAYVVIPNTVLENPEVLMYSRGGSGIAFEGSVRSDIEPVIVRARLLKQVHHSRHRQSSRGCARGFAKPARAAISAREPRGQTPPCGPRSPAGRRR